MTREDRLESKILYENYNIEALDESFEDTHKVLQRFFEIKFFIENIYKDLPVSFDLKMKAENIVKKYGKYLNEEISLDEIISCRRDAWVECDKHTNPGSNLFRVIVCILGSKEEYLSSRETAQDDFFSSVLFSLYKLNSLYCRIFREFIEEQPEMQRYKL